MVNEFGTVQRFTKKYLKKFKYFEVEFGTAFCLPVTLMRLEGIFD